MTEGGPRPARTYATSPYPGEVPTYPYCTDSGRVLALRQDQHGAFTLDDGEPLTAWLAARGDLVVPLLTYGSNACPGRLAMKFGLDVDGVVCMPATLVGAARVLSAEISSIGSRPMTLAGLPTAREGSHVLLLPARYASAMDRSEGRGGPYYALVRLTGCTVEIGTYPVRTWREPLAYLGHQQRGPLLVQGRPRAADPERQPLIDAVEDAGRRTGDEWLPEHQIIDETVPLTSATDLARDAVLGEWLGPWTPEPGLDRRT